MSDKKSFPSDGHAGVNVAAVPRYLRFGRSLILGTALGAAPLVAGCEASDSHCDDCEVAQPDGSPVDAGPVEVDGPLPPPDLPRTLA